MIDKKNLVKGFLAFSVGQWVSALISFLTTPIITLFVSPKDFGKSAMFTVAYSLLHELLFMGTHQSFVRMFYERKNNSERKELLYECVIPTIVLRLFVIFFLILFLEASFIYRVRWLLLPSCYAARCDVNLWRVCELGELDNQNGKKGKAVFLNAGSNSRREFRCYNFACHNIAE